MADWNDMLAGVAGIDAPMPAPPTAHERAEQYVKGREDEYERMRLRSEGMNGETERRTDYVRRMAWFDEEHQRIHLHSPMAILPPYPSGWVKPTPFPRIPGPTTDRGAWEIPERHVVVPVDYEPQDYDYPPSEGWLEFVKALGREPTARDKQRDAEAWAVGG